MRRRYVVFTAALTSFGMLANSTAAGAVLLPAESAFLITARRVSARAIAVDFTIAPGYVLYRDRFSFSSDSPNVRLVNAVFPTPTVKFDKAMDKEVAFYSDHVSVHFAIDGAAVPFRLTVRAQGCEVEQGVCYPPISKDFQVPPVK